MNKLNDHWLTEGLIDFEYKKYTVLGYLKTVREAFGQQLLYPTLSDLVFHYRNLLSIRDHGRLLEQQFPKEISKADFQKLKLSYRKMVKDDETMLILKDVLQFAIPKFGHLLEEGKELYESIASNLELEPIGITPIRKSEGYIFMQPHRPADLRIYYYQMSIFQQGEGKLRGLHLQFLEQLRKGIGETYEGIKIRLIREYRNLPNPATFLINAHIPCPIEESLLPIAKRKLLMHLTAGE